MSPFIYHEVDFYPFIPSRVTVTQSSVLNMSSRWIIIDRETLVWFIAMVFILIMCWMLAKFIMWHGYYKRIIE